MVDWNHVGMLLHIVDKSKDHPKLSALTQAALAELDQHASHAAEEWTTMRQQAENAKLEEARTKEAELKKAEPSKEPERPVPSFIRRDPTPEQSNGS